VAPHNAQGLRTSPTPNSVERFRQALAWAVSEGLSPEGLFQERRQALDAILEGGGSLSPELCHAIAVAYAEESAKPGPEGAPWLPEERQTLQEISRLAASLLAPPRTGVEISPDASGRRGGMKA
jgi:hypothetical protein